jgi:hypothetical protein
MFCITDIVAFNVPVGGLALMYKEEFNKLAV